MEKIRCIGCLNYADWKNECVYDLFKNNIYLCPCLNNCLVAPICDRRIICHIKTDMVYQDWKNNRRPWEIVLGYKK